MSMGIRWRWNDWPITRKSLVVVALPLLLLLVSLVTIYSVERQNIAAERDVRETLEVLSDLHEAHSLLAETAAAVRGYRLVGRDEFLTPYRNAEPQLTTVIERLSGRIQDPDQARRFAAIKPLFAEKMQGWRRLLAPDIAPADEMRELTEGKYKLDILRAELRELRDYEAIQLQQRTQKEQALRQRNLLVTLGAALLGGLGAVLAVTGFVRGLSRRLLQLSANAARLGDGLPLQVHAPAGDEIGQVAHSLAQAGNLLAARATDAQLARRDAEAASLAKTEFLSRSSHELRTPLNAILGYAQVLQMDLADGSAQRRHVDHIHRAGRHLLGLITDLLDISRIESDQLELSIAATPVRTAIEETIGLLAPEAASRGSAIDTAGADGGLAVRADAQRLRQVLINLLSNAIKFNRPTGRVQVRCRVVGDQVEIAVTDEGRGVSDNDAARLFTPFERLGAERSAIEGTGLGLAVSKRLIEAMGGSIGVDTSHTPGARFWIRLPRETIPVVSATEPPVAITPAQVQARTLLSIEDNPSNQALIRTLLERRPHWRLLEAGTLADARALLAHTTPDLLLLDLHLGDGHGKELINELQANPASAGIPIVVVSADATQATLTRVNAAGVRAFLTKPLDISQFFALLDAPLT